MKPLKGLFGLLDQLPCFFFAFLLPSFLLPLPFLYCSFLYCSNCGFCISYHKYRKNHLPQQQFNNCFLSIQHWDSVGCTISRWKELRWNAAKTFITFSDCSLKLTWWKRYKPVLYRTKHQVTQNKLSPPEPLQFPLSKSWQSYSQVLDGNALADPFVPPASV